MSFNSKKSRKKIHRFSKSDIFRFVVDVALSSAPVASIPSMENYQVCFGQILGALRRDSNTTMEDENHVEERDIDILGEVAQELTFSNSLHGEPLEPYFSLAHVLRDCLNQELHLPPLAIDDLRWMEAIQIAFAYNEYCRLTLNGIARKPQERDLTFADAVQYFTDRGLSLPLVGEELEIISSKTANALSATVAKPMRRIGDEESSKFFDFLLKLRYDPRARRCRLHPSPDFMGRKVLRSIPCGYLYRSLLKVIGNAGEQSVREVDLVHIEMSAKHLAALYNVEPFSSYEGMFPPKAESALKNLLTVTNYDELFTIPQCRPELMEQLLIDLFPVAITVTARATLGWGASEAMCLWRVLSQLSLNDTDSVFIDREDLRSKLSELIGAQATRAILKSFVLVKPNRNYHLPVNAATAESRECALVEASRNKYWRPGQIFFGPAFFDRMFAQLVAEDPSLSDKVGQEFEKRMQRRFRDAGYSPLYGKYCGDVKSQTGGDVDILLQSDELIALIECKKKGMRRTAIAGNDLHLVTDLAKGLINGVNQLSKQEMLLLDKKNIKLVDGTLIEHRGRRIIKIILSLADYGGLHDAQTLRHTMRAISDANLTLLRPVPGSDVKALEDANETLRVMGVRQKKFEELKADTSSDQDIFSNLQFHNVFLVEELIEKKKTVDEFLVALAGIPSVFTGTRDPIIDLVRFENLG